MNFFVRNLNTKVLENKTFLISVNKNFSDLPEAKSLHLSAKVAFQFEGRSNFAFDCFIMAVHFVLYLTYYFFHLICGGGLKSRFSLPFYKFYR